MKNLNQKREKAISCCEYIFFLNAQFLPFRFPQNIPLKENRHLRNMALVFAEKHVSFGGCNRGEKPTFLNWYLCSGFPAQSPKMGIVTTVWPIIWCKSLWVTNNLEIDFGKETPTPFSKLVSYMKKKYLLKSKSYFVGKISCLSLNWFTYPGLSEQAWLKQLAIMTPAFANTG